MEIHFDVQITQEQKQELAAGALYKEFCKHPVGLVKGCYIIDAEESGMSIKNLYLVDGEVTASKYNPDDYYIASVSSSFDVEAFGEACKELAIKMGCSLQSLLKAVANIGIAIREQGQQMESLKAAVDDCLKKMEYVDCVIEEYLEWNKQGWHTHHKEGKPCKAKVKPPYWHRVRSFCVRSNYH